MTALARRLAALERCAPPPPPPDPERRKALDAIAADPEALALAERLQLGDDAGAPGSPERWDAVMSDPAARAVLERLSGARP